MRHANNTCKLGRDTGHRRCLWANMLKALIHHERIETTLEKAKFLRSKADRMITLAKKNTLAAKRQAAGEMMVRYNTLTPKERKAAKGGDTSAYNDDRLIIGKLFSTLGPRFVNRHGGYTRIIKMSDRRLGDNGSKCVIEFLKD